MSTQFSIQAQRVKNPEADALMPQPWNHDRAYGEFNTTPDVFLKAISAAPLWLQKDLCYAAITGAEIEIPARYGFLRTALEYARWFATAKRAHHQHHKNHDVAYRREGGPAFTRRNTFTQLSLFAEDDSGKHLVFSGQTKEEPNNE